MHTLYYGVHRGESTSMYASTRTRIMVEEELLRLRLDVLLAARLGGSICAANRCPRRVLCEEVWR